jgi:hypothetical protein
METLILEGRQGAFDLAKTSFREILSEDQLGGIENLADAIGTAAPKL